MDDPSLRLPGLSYPNLFRIQVLRLAWCSSSGVALAWYLRSGGHRGADRPDRRLWERNLEALHGGAWEDYAHVHISDVLVYIR